MLIRILTKGFIRTLASLLCKHMRKVQFINELRINEKSHTITLLIESVLIEISQIAIKLILK